MVCTFNELYYIIINMANLIMLKLELIQSGNNNN